MMEPKRGFSLLYRYITAALLAAATATAQTDELLLSRGLPLQLPAARLQSHYGNRFCIAFPASSAQQLELSILVLTDQSVPVDFVLEFHSSRDSINGTVQRENATHVQLPSSLAVLPTDNLRNFNAFSVRTSNSSHSISVVGVVSHSSGRLGTFLTLPTVEVSGVSRYQYSQFSSSSSSLADYSMFVLASCDSNIVPYLQAPPSLDGVVAVRDIYRLVTDSRLVIESDRPTPVRMLFQYETFHFENNTRDMTGIFAWANRPLSFYATQTCGNDASDCDQLLEQVPPAYTWGYLFFLIPFQESPGYVIRILPRYNETMVEWDCHGNDSDSGSVDLTLEGLTINVTSACAVMADRPVAVMQYTIDMPAMVWVTGVSQYLQEHRFVTGLEEDFRDYISVTVTDECFSSTDITIDGEPIEVNGSLWSPLSCGSVCGYGVSKEVVSKGTHLVQHSNTSCTVNVVSYGWRGDGNGYAYPVGYGMDPIGVPVISFERTQYSASESDSSLTIGLTRVGDVMKDDVLVIIEAHTSCPESGDRTLASEDFVTPRAVVSFKSGQVLANGTLQIRDDLQVEPAKTFCLVIKRNEAGGDIFPVGTAQLVLQDNDNLQLGFEHAEVSVSEASQSVSLTVRSNIPIQQTDLLLRVSTISETAERLRDYSEPSPVLNLQRGDTSRDIVVNINSDVNVENSETFVVMISLDRNVEHTTITNDRVRVTILDDDSATFTIRLLSTAVTEKDDMLSFEVIKDGGNEIPLVIFVSTYDITATANVDYDPLDRLELTYSSSDEDETKNITVSLNDDLFLEEDEKFGLTLSTLPRYVNQVRFTGNVTVTVADDDNITVGFNSSSFEVFENRQFVALTLVVVGDLLPFRDFLVHVMTSPVQATEGKDFTPINADIVFPANQSSHDIFINITDNKIAEQTSEAFTVTLTTSQNDSHVTILGATTTVTIKDDSEDRVLVVFDTNITYTGKEGEGPVMIRLVKFGSSDTSVQVEILSFPNERSTAIIDEDFLLDNAIVTFGANETVKVYPLIILTDNTVEEMETVILLLAPISGPVRVDLDQELVVSILDLTAVIIEFTSATYSTIEGQPVVVNISVTGVSNRSDIVLSVTTVFGTAQESDFTPLMTTIEVQSNVTLYSILIETKEDRLLERTETFNVSFTLMERSGNEDIRISSARVFIQDNDS